MQSFKTSVAGMFLALSLIPQTTWSHTPWTFDGARLGEGFRDEFIQHMKLVPPCDVDSINGGARSVALFTAKPCRGEGMTEHTTIILFTSPALTSQTPNSPVDALAWMGGTYLNTRSDFPLRIGANESEVIRQFGPISEEASFRKGDSELKVARYEGSVYSMSLLGKTVGFIVGTMPPISFDDEEHDEWRAILGGWFQFTQPALPPAQPSDPSDPVPPAPTPDPAGTMRIQEFMALLLQPGSDAARFRAIAPHLHSSLIRKDGTDFAPGVREYAYRRALKNAPFYASPTQIGEVHPGEWTVIGSGPTAEEGRIDKYFVMRRLENGGGSAPIHLFFAKDNKAPVILNFGSL